MNYFATIVKLENLRAHPNPDVNRLKVADALGFQVIVGIDADTSGLWVLFPSDGRLSHEMLLHNNLYRKHPETGVEMGGYFEENGRVKGIRLRGAKSEAFVTPITSLSWTGYDLNKLEVGFEFDELNGKKVCQKYYTPATLRAMKQNQGSNKTLKAKDFAPDFYEHFKTEKVRHNLYDIVGKKTYVISEKNHGTSGRTGRVLWKKRTFWQNILAKFGLYRDKYRLITGTRKVVYDPDKMNLPDTGYYSGSMYRNYIHNMFDELGLNDGEIVYYEIVGWTDTGAPIMGEHNLSKLAASGVPKSEYKQYPDPMVFSYGCEYGEYDIYVYRITQDGKDLMYEDMVSRCAELGLKVVPHLATVTLQGWESPQEVMKLCDDLTLGASVLDTRHFKEGICLRRDKGDGQIVVYKYKGELFCILEGIQKNDPNYVDAEEVG